MLKEELEAELNTINQTLGTLGDLNSIITEARQVPSLINDLTVEKGRLESVLVGSTERLAQLDDVLAKSKEVSDQLPIQTANLKTAIEQAIELQVKVESLVRETQIQLGKAANEKLANSFEIVKERLIVERNRWFIWLWGSVLLLIAAVISVTIWQTYQGRTIFELGFLIRLALTSPIIYFVGFATTEYARAQNLIEEYTFKASIARSFEAYKEIIESLFRHDNVDAYESQKLEFIIGTMRYLYSSPMNNIRNNNHNEKKPMLDFSKKIEELAFDKIKNLLG